MKSSVFDLRFMIFVLVVVAAFSNGAKAQMVAVDSISHERILVGSIERSAFRDSSWYKDNYTLYKPSEKIIHEIDSLGAGDSVMVVLGSWCSDSHMWVPMFLSITDSTVLAKRIGFIATPRSSGWRDQLTPGLNIEKVPTFIFYHDGKEIGRIVEEPRGDISEIIVSILAGKSIEAVH